MANILRYPLALTQIDQVTVFDDFCGDQADTAFIDTVTDSGTVAMGDDVGGVATLTPSDGTVSNNDEAYFASPNEVFKIAAGKPMYGRARLKFTEGATDDVNVGFFFQNAISANSILDDGAGLKVSGDTLGIYKVDGGLVWRCVSAVNGTSTVSVSGTLSTSTGWQLLEIEVVDFTSTHMKVLFRVNGQILKDSDDRDIVHTIAVASATEMQVGVGIKNGADTTAEALLVDYIAAIQYTGAR